MMSSEKPASMENSSAFLHAKASSSSLFVTGGPLTDKAAITSPFSFQIIGPYPEQFWSAKIAASKFILKTECGGGCHFFLTDAGVKIESCNSCWCLKSLRKSISLLFSQLGSLKLLPYSTAFLWFHINHAWTRNTSGSDLDSLSTRYSNRSIIS